MPEAAAAEEEEDSAAAKVAIAAVEEAAGLEVAAAEEKVMSIWKVEMELEMAVASRDAIRGAIWLLPRDSTQKNALRMHPNRPIIR